MNDLEFDANHIWHPYAGLPAKYPICSVAKTSGVTITLDDGRELIDGMSSWWSAIHGYNHPVLIEALKKQADKFPHIMFGGLTHKPAIKLADKLITITPLGLEKVFFSDSGSVAVEVAIKMSLQYHLAKGNPNKNRLLSFIGAYHGDTIGAMSVCDPKTGMHHLFNHILAKNEFVGKPLCKFADEWHESYFDKILDRIKKHHKNIAAFILEPIVQGAGGMNFYHRQYLSEIRKLCRQYDILLIADEIATGFGRTGRLFACEWADVSPDIMCLGKALTGGTMTMAATLTTEEISNIISKAPPHVFMHGPTFMANPLACSVSLASVELLLNSNWQKNVKVIESDLRKNLELCAQLNSVADVRVLGAIGVVELRSEVNMPKVTETFVNSGVWVRPFGRLVYIMPAYIISSQEIEKISAAIYEVCESAD